MAEFVSIPMLALVTVLVLTAIRKVGSHRLAIWQVMTGGALVVLLSGSITPPAALQAIDWNVMVFLWAMFVLGEALELSGVLDWWLERATGWVSTVGGVIWLVGGGSAILSALLMNDTVAILGAPLIVRLAKRNAVPALPLLLVLAFGVTIGSVASPIGNPQNLLIATGAGLDSPFLVFGEYLLAPTLINLVLLVLLVRFFFGRELFHKRIAVSRGLRRPTGRLARATVWGVMAMVGAIVGKVVISATVPGFDLPLVAVALVGAAPVFVSGRSSDVLKRLDWYTLLFFAAMFVLMQAVWDTGAFQGALGGRSYAETPLLLWGSVGLSQLMSNVPAVALGLPLLEQWGASELHHMALAAGSTLAGNLFILGAASNVIVIQGAEKHGTTVTFWEFSRVGIPLTILNVLVCWLFLSL